MRCGPEYPGIILQDLLATAAAVKPRKTRSLTNMEAVRSWKYMMWELDRRRAKVLNLGPGGSEKQTTLLYILKKHISLGF